MQMIDVLKRLAELDAENPNVAQPTMKAEQSLGTISNISESINECGGPMGMPNTPASFSINASAESGDEVANMLTQIMGLAGIKKDVEVPALPAVDKEVELGAPHGVELDGGNDDMANMISMIDKMNGPDDAGQDKPEDEGLLGALAGGAVGAAVGGPLGALQGAAAGDSLTDADPDEKEGIEDFSNRDGQQSPIADMADEVEGMASELADLNSEENENYDNSPEEEIKAHDYGDSQVTPKPQGLKQRLGDNPYKQVGESVDKVTLDLLKAYQEFKAQQ